VTALELHAVRLDAAEQSAPRVLSTRHVLSLSCDTYGVVEAPWQNVFVQPFLSAPRFDSLAGASKSAAPNRGHLDPALLALFGGK
jgi:hypothetical protein